MLWAAWKGAVSHRPKQRVADAVEWDQAQACWIWVQGELAHSAAQGLWLSRRKQGRLAQLLLKGKGLQTVFWIVKLNLFLALGGWDYPALGHHSAQNLLTVKMNWNPDFQVIERFSMGLMASIAAMRNSRSSDIFFTFCSAYHADFLAWSLMGFGHWFVLPVTEQRRSYGCSPERSW